MTSQTTRGAGTLGSVGAAANSVSSGRTAGNSAALAAVATAAVSAHCKRLCALNPAVRLHLTRWRSVADILGERASLLPCDVTQRRASLHVSSQLPFSVVLLRNATACKYCGRRWSLGTFCYPPLLSCLVAHSPIVAAYRHRRGCYRKPTTPLPRAQRRSQQPPTCHLPPLPTYTQQTGRPSAHNPRPPMPSLCFFPTSAALLCSALL